LKNGIDYCATASGMGHEWRDHCAARLDRATKAGDVNEMLNIADLIVDGLGGESAHHFRVWLSTSVGRLRVSPQGDRFLSILRELSQRGIILATTNYDSVLASTFNLQPILWSDYPAELPVMNQAREGILHLHGHWESPPSVIFSRNSYDRIVNDDTFQTLFRHLWLGYHWIYIGCGSGVDDPNFGRLLMWGAEKFGSASLSHFRLCLNAETLALAAEARNHANLRLIGYGPQHDDLPKFLEDLSEALPCRPFTRIREQGQFFRTPTQQPRDVILPSRSEYLEGAVHRPKFVGDVEARLTESGFAWLRGPASRGKTTAALLIATSKSRCDHPVYYLDLNDVPVAPAGATLENVMQSLSRPRALLIVDNVNRDQALARRLYDAWSKDRHGSNLLLLGRTEPEAGITPHTSRALADLESQAVTSEVGCDDLAGLFKTLLRRLSIGRTPPVPPREVLLRWQETFSSDLVAFCWAVTARYRKLRLCDWDLGPEAASRFVWAKYLEPLAAPERHDILLLAIFARHELGLPPDVFGPDPFSSLVRTGIVLRKYNDGSNDRFHFHEPGLAPLLLGAVEDRMFNEAEEINSVCARSPSVAVAYSARLEASGERDAVRRIASLLLNEDAAKWILTDHLPWAVDTIRRMLLLHAAEPDDIDDWLTGAGRVLA
jgi:hypothetical protein